MYYVAQIYLFTITRRIKFLIVNILVRHCNTPEIEAYVNEKFTYLLLSWLYSDR